MSNTLVGVTFFLISLGLFAFAFAVFMEEKRYRESIKKNGCPKCGNKEFLSDWYTYLAPEDPNAPPRDRPRQAREYKTLQCTKCYHYVYGERNPNIEAGILGSGTIVNQQEAVNYMGVPGVAYLLVILTFTTIITAYIAWYIEANY